MKKIIMCLFMSVMLLGLMACSNVSSDEQGESDSQGKVSESVTEEIPVYKELADPRGKTLESTATGESNPQIVKTTYETDDVVVADFIPTEMGYAVDPTGETDSTAGIQAALYDCFYAGGGTVYLPTGNYAISDTIFIPPYVTLRGDWQDPDEGTEYGTIISVWMEAEDSEGAGAFKVSGCAGAVGLTVYYPQQSLDCIIPYPYAFYLEETAIQAMLSTIKDITIINGYRGIGTSSAMNHEQLQLENIHGTFLHCGIGIANSSDVGTVKSICINNKYWKEATAECMNAVLGSMIDAYTKENVTGIRVGDLEWTTFNDVSVDNCAVGVHFVKGTRIDFAGSLYDFDITDCTKGIVFDGLDSRWGACIAKSHVEGGITNNTEGKVKLCDVEVTGEIIEREKGSVVIDAESDLSKYAIDYEVSYTKPASNLWVAKLPSGLDTDASSQLQKLLNEAANEGGIVYVPGGMYCFNSPITVPAGVELRGATSVPTRESAGTTAGTLFYCYYGDDSSYDKDDQAFITLAGENAGLNGVRIIYPENRAKTGDFISTYTVRGTASGVYVVNTMIAGSAYGVDFKNCDNHYIEGVMTTCYYNAFRLGGSGGTLSKCLQNGTVQQRTAAPSLDAWDTGEFGELIGLMRTNCDYIIVEDGSEQLIYNAFAYGAKTVVNNVNSENTRAINMGTDNMGTDVPQFIQNGGSMTGINILRYNGYSYELLKGKINLYNRIAINEVGERTTEKSK